METRGGHLSIQIFIAVLASGVRSLIATRGLEVAFLEGLEELLWIPLGSLGDPNRPYYQG